MQPTDDSVLLQQYAENHSDTAFATLVSRHVNLVYSVAVRCVGDPHQAEEVAQAVFILLARKAGQLRDDKALSSWLFRTTRLTASNYVRGETRRHRREQEAHMQSVLNDPESDFWPRIAPMLDDAVAELNEIDRRAIMLRFYEGRNLREVGAALDASEDAAEKRVHRAVEKLRTFFAKRGVTVGASGLVVVISANAVQAAPVGLAVTISTAAVLAGTTLTSSSTGFSAALIKLMASTKIKTAGVIAAVTLGTGTCVLLQERAVAATRRDNRALDAEVASLAGVRAENERLARWEAENQSQIEAQKLRDELLRLRGQAAGLRNQLTEQRRLAAIVNVPSINGALLDAPSTSFRLAAAKDVGTRTPMALLQTKFWARHTGNAERFRELWVEAPNVSEREKKRGLILRESSFKRMSGDFRFRDLDDYQELRLLEQTPSEDGTEIQLVTQLRGKAGWKRSDWNLRRVGDEWRFVMLMQPNVLTPSVPE